MTLDKKAIVTRQVLSSGWQTCQSHWLTILLIVGVGLVVPQLVLTVLLDVLGSQAAVAVREITAAAAAGVSFETLLEPALAFVGWLALATVLLLLLILTGYFALVHLAVRQWRGMSVPSAASLMAMGLRSAVPRGFLLLVLFLVTAVLGQVLVLPALAIAILGTVAPVIAVAENKGAWRSLSEALAIRYARQAQCSAWSVFFTAMTLTTILYAGALAVVLASERLLALDAILGFGRELYTARLGSWPIGPAYLAVNLFETLTLMLILASFPLLTTALYFEATGRREITSA